MEMRFSSEEESFLADEVKALLEKGVIKYHNISLIFRVPESDDSFKMILNLIFILKWRQ